MKMSKECADCLYDKEVRDRPDPGYLKEVRRLIDEREERATSPLMVYRFSQVMAERGMRPRSFKEDKRRYNDLVLGLEDRFRERIRTSSDPLRTALLYARVGNYIDFGTLESVDEETFLGLFDEADMRPEEEKVYQSFLSQLAEGERFLLVEDNCGEIVLDKLFLEEMGRTFPHLTLQAMVRGGEVLNDVTLEDAAQTGLDKAARVISSGAALPGTVYALMSDEAREALDRADVILAKGQGNYESLSGEGRHIFYCFLCKCQYFADRFRVPRLTGMLIEERA